MNTGRLKGRQARGLGALAAVLMGVVLASACAGRQAVQQPLPDARAEIQQVEVLAPLGNRDALGTGDMLVALVRGTLPSACYRAGEAVVVPGGSLIAVIIPAAPQSVAGGACGGPAAFERLVALGGGFASGSYTVSVNGVSAVFTVPDAMAEEAKPAEQPSGGEQAATTQEGGTAGGDAQPSGQAEAQTVETEPEPAAEEQAPVTVPVTAGAGSTAQTETVAAAAAVAVPAASQESTGAVPSAECENKAAFFKDVSVDDGTSFAPGEKFVKIWRIQNAGTCTWQGYRLVFDSGDRMSAPDPVVIPGTVAPGGLVDIELALTAPNRPDGYFSNWLLTTQAGQQFGLGNPAIGLLWTKIGVRMPSSGSSGGASCAWTTDVGIENEVLRLVNLERSKVGLQPLVLNERLSTASRGHSADMACNFFVGHAGSDRSDWSARIARQGVAFRDSSENIVYGWINAQEAMDWWMDSKTHRENILNPRSRQVGVGYAYYDDSQFGGYYTLNFTAP